MNPNIDSEPVMRAYTIEYLENDMLTKVEMKAHDVNELRAKIAKKYNNKLPWVRIISEGHIRGCVVFAETEEGKTEYIWFTPDTALFYTFGTSKGTEGKLNRKMDAKTMYQTYALTAVTWVMIGYPLIDYRKLTTAR